MSQVLMAGRFQPVASSFIAFNEHDPHTSDQCIYLTLKGARCLWSCRERDNARAIELYETIQSLPAAAVSIELVKDYILCNCCMSGRARHREKIEDAGLWTPLAERWLDEIQRDALSKIKLFEKSSKPVEEGSVLSGDVTRPSTPTPSRSTVIYSSPSASSPASNVSSINTTPSTSVTTPSEYHNASPKPTTAGITLASQSLADQSIYNLRPREYTASAAARSRTPLSEFRAHIAEPGPDDSVSSKICDVLEDRDFKTGSLYIFDRDSSPGHVKIGWTARSVQGRLDDWSLCGYTPNLLFSVLYVPYAQRAETLTHYELMKEWRRERQCKASHCRKSHQEWFEVSKERAIEVAGDWARFMRIAKPYESSGRLKAQWVDFVKKAIGKGELLTAKMLLDYYEHPVTEVATPVKKSTDSGDRVKAEELEEAVQIKQVPQRKLIKSEEPLSSKGEATPGLELPRTPSPEPKEESKSSPLFEFGPLPKLEFSFRSEALQKGTSRLVIENTLKSKLFSELRSPSTELPVEWKTKDFSFEFPSSLLSLSVEKPFNEGLLPKTPESIKTSSSSRTVSSSPDETLVAPDSLLNTVQQFRFGSLADTKLGQKTQDLPSTGFTFGSEPLFKIDPSWKSPLSSTPRSTSGAGSLFNFKETLTKALSEKASEDEKLPAGQISPPPGPAPRHIDSQHSPTAKLLAPNSCIKSEEASTTDEAITSESEASDSQEEESGRKSGVKVDHDKVVIESKSVDKEGEWEDEETLVEPIGPEYLKKAALQLVSELGNEIGIEKTKGSHKAMDKPTVSVSEVLPAVQVAAQA